IVGIAAGILALIPPYFLGLLIDTTIPEGSRWQLVELASMLAIVALTTATFNVVRQLGILRLETKLSAAVQPAMWDRLLGLPIPFFRRFTAGDLTQRVGCVDAMRRVLSGATMLTLTSSVFSIFLLGQLFYYSWRLALVATGLVILAMLLTTAFAALK